ncbi:hypothetical protein DFJ58DRAFT_733255 [Suillus subalutaceus]|uniref:uncharacterized protein n=1 Tax=Suillus subalutaceus TaxID=48586 RepID=UPI001B85F9B3|nr:uncharacterized protein DFJ58DRAFT_733255 [Suillus subalutaceus]KAG1839666.1 hypothetical protein DFJ58DRAFT_733255 [Suillus subalutaceus]
MSSSPLLHLPHSTTSDGGHAFTCPNCADMFASSDSLMCNLSTTVTCGQWVVQGLTSDFNYDDLEHEQDVYGKYKDVDTLDDAEEDDVSLNNPSLSSLPQPEQHHPSTSSQTTTPPIVSVDPSAGPCPGTLRDYHPNVPITHPGGENHLQKMDRDIHAAIHHMENLYYPFASKAKFDLGYWLLEGALSQKEVDFFLHLEHISCLTTFHTASVF